MKTCSPSYILGIHILCCIFFLYIRYTKNFDKKRTQRWWAYTYGAWISCAAVSPAPSTVNTPLVKVIGSGFVKEMRAVSLCDTIASPIIWNFYTENWEFYSFGQYLLNWTSAMCFCTLPLYGAWAFLRGCWPHAEWYFARPWFGEVLWLWSSDALIHMLHSDRTVASSLLYELMIIGNIKESIEHKKGTYSTYDIISLCIYEPQKPICSLSFLCTSIPF